MSIRDGNSPPVRLDQPILIEFEFVTVLLAGVYLWQRSVIAARSALSGWLPPMDGLLVTGLVSGGFFVGGVVGLAVAYVTARDLDVGLPLPGRADLPLVALAGVGPVVLVGLTKLVGAATGVPYNSLTMTSYAADAPLVPVATVADPVVVSRIAELGSVAGGLFAATHLAVLAVAAYTYDRTNTLLLPALAYGCLSAADTLVVYLFEAGMRSW